MFLYIFLIILYLVVEYIQLGKMINPKVRLQILKHYPQQHQPLDNLSPAASQIIISQNPVLTRNMLYGIVMDWALKDLVTLKPIDANFGLKDDKIDDFIVFKKDNPDKILSLKNWEKDLYQDFFAFKNSFQVSHILFSKKIKITWTSSDEIKKYWQIPQQILKEELANLIINKKYITKKNFIWLILPFFQIRLFEILIGIIMPTHIISYNPTLPTTNLVITLFMGLTLISSYLFILSSIVIVILALINKNQVPIRSSETSQLLSLNSDGLNVKQHLLGLIKYIRTAEKERIIFHTKDKSLSEITLLPYAVTFGIIEPLIDFDTEPRIIDKSEYKPSIPNISKIIRLIIAIVIIYEIIRFIVGLIQFLS